MIISSVSVAGRVVVVLVATFEAPSVCCRGGGLAAEAATSIAAAVPRRASSPRPLLCLLRLRRSPRQSLAPPFFVFCLELGRSPVSLPRF